MRILFTFVGGTGHFEPLAAIARCAAASGHSVAFGFGASMLPTVEAAGFRGFAIGTASSAPPARVPLRPLDSEREDQDLRERFVRRAARYRAPRAIALCREWRPDVIVCDETDFGLVIAAECLSLPHATVQVIAAGSFVRSEVVGEALNELRAEHGLPPDPGLEMLSRYLVLSPFPRSYRDPAHPMPPTAHAFRPSRPGRAEVPGPDWSRVREGAPAVYFTLGTVFNLECGDLFSRAVAGLRELPINLLVTVGSDIDPAELGPQPAHVHITQFVPQALVLPYCHLIVSHGGSGSVMGALEHGLPSVLIPMGADQPMNASRCAELGVARVLDPMVATPESVREAATLVLDDPGYRRHAARLRDEIAGLPDVGHAVRLIERLAVERIPLRA